MRGRVKNVPSPCGDGDTLLYAVLELFLKRFSNLARKRLVVAVVTARLDVMMFGVAGMAMGGVGVMGGLLVIASLVVLGGFAVMLGGVFVVLGSLVMVVDACVVAHCFALPGWRIKVCKH
jgi:hypothetical protein